MGIHSFRHKILRTVALSMLVVLSATGIGLVVIESWLNENRLRQDLQVLAAIIGNRSISALEKGDWTAAENILAAARHHRYVDAICLYNNRGELFAAFNRSGERYLCGPRRGDLPLSARAGGSTQSAESIDSTESAPQPLPSDRAPPEAGSPGPFERLPADNRLVYEPPTSLASKLTVHQRIEHMDQTVGSLHVIANRGYLVEALQLFVPLMLVLIALVVLVSSRIMTRALYTVTKPLEDLHDTAQAVVDDVYSARRVTRSSDDEIGGLVEVFNRMLDNLASENLALQSSENRFRTLTANAPIGIFQLDRECNLVYANTRWYQITEAGGEAHPYAVHRKKIAPEDVELYHNSWRRAEQKNVPILVEYCYTRGRSGGRKYLMENVAPMRSDTGLEGFIGTLADVTELKNAQKELEKLAFYDPLTNLPNRRFFVDLLGFGLAKARRTGEMAAVMMLDMDNFKRVNDLLGHSGGDQLLQQQAQRIRAAVREQDAVSRMGGDEFTIMLSPVTEAAEVTGLAKRVLEAVNTPVTIGSHTLEVGASIGVALYPGDGEQADDLIRNADMALYEAKGAGRNRVNYFSFKLDLELRESLRIEQKLKAALHEGVLQAYVQPQVAADGNVSWGEALVRWYDPEDGFIEPSRFVALAEETGLIHSLGHWMLEQVCFHLAQHRQYLDAVGIRGVAVNLSGRQFYARSLLKDIRHVMESSGTRPEQLEFEITESVVMDDIQAAIDTMRALRDMGCKIAIDDFGTGYSSLACLKRFPISALKIDRSFVEDIPHDNHGSEIATAIIAMAHKLRLQVVAEGVETPAQRDFLVAQGCESLQGYLFGKPIPIQDYINEGRAKISAQHRTGSPPAL